MKKARAVQKRRERRKAKQQEWTRVPCGKVGHHTNMSHWHNGARIKLPCR